MNNIYDLIIVGAGPAGLSAGIYGGRGLLNTLIIEKFSDGGQIITSHLIDNYPGSLDDETGYSLVSRMTKQVEKFGVKRINDTVIDCDFSGKIKKIIGKKEIYEGKAIIIASGANARELGCKGEKEYKGLGVSYCATCDGAFFKGLNIYVVGGGDSAIEEALYLTRFAKKVTIIHRRDKLRASKGLQQKAFDNNKIDFIWDSVIKEIKGDGNDVNNIVVENVKTGKIKEIIASEEDKSLGVFIFIGLDPNTKIFENHLKLRDGYIEADEDMKTNIRGVFAAGDCRVKKIRQVVTAVSDGAIAAVNVEKYLEEEFN